MHPPTSLKVTILAEKSALILNNSAPFRDASPPTDLNVTNPAEKSVSILVKTFFFFFFFWRPPFWSKKTFEFPISAEKSVSILVKTSEFLRFWLQIPPTKIFWIRHCVGPALLNRLIIKYRAVNKLTTLQFFVPYNHLTLPAI